MNKKIEMISGQPTKQTVFYDPATDRQPIDIIANKTGTINTTSQEIYTDSFNTPEYFFIITSIAAYQQGTGTPQIKLGVKRASGEKFLLKSGTVANAEDSVDFSSELNLNYKDQLFANFEGAAASGEIQLIAHGYRVKR